MSEKEKTKTITINKLIAVSVAPNSLSVNSS